MRRGVARQSSWTKYSWMWSRGRSLEVWRSMEKVSTWPRRKLARALPPVVVVAAADWVSVPVVVKAKEPVGLGGEMVLSWYQR